MEVGKIYEAMKAGYVRENAAQTIEAMIMTGEKVNVDLALELIKSQNLLIEEPEVKALMDGMEKATELLKKYDFFYGKGTKRLRGRKPQYDDGESGRILKLVNLTMVDFDNIKPEFDVIFRYCKRLKTATFQDVRFKTIPSFLVNSDIETIFFNNCFFFADISPIFLMRNIKNLSFELSELKGTDFPVDAFKKTQAAYLSFASSKGFTNNGDGSFPLWLTEIPKNIVDIDFMNSGIKELPDGLYSMTDAKLEFDGCFYDIWMEYIEEIARGKIESALKIAFPKAGLKYNR